MSDENEYGFDLPLIHLESRSAAIVPSRLGAAAQVQQRGK